MKASELRIGNLVEYNGIPMNVWAIGNNSSPKKESYYVDLDSQEHDRHLKGIELEELERIPLTEEWLVNFGGEIKPFESGIIFDRFKLIWKEAYNYWYVIDANTLSYITKVEFVHEWQNVVFSLNGV